MKRLFLILGIVVLLSSVAAAEKKLDPLNFHGEKIEVKQATPAQIKNLNVDISFPANHEFYSEAAPYVRLVTGKGSEVGKFTLKETSSTFLVNKTIRDNKIYAVMALYYCKKGNQGLCLMKNVLFEIPVDQTLTKNNLTLHYDVKEEN